MRKILAFLLLLCVLFTSIFFVACDKAKEEGQTTTDTQQTTTTSDNTNTTDATTDSGTTTNPSAEPAFSGTVFDAFTQLKTKGTIDWSYTTSEPYGAFISEITYDGLTMGGSAGYAMVYVNDVEYRDEFQSMGNDYSYKGEMFYASTKGISFITYKEGLKVLILYTEPVAPGPYTYAPKQGDALLFTLPDGVEKTTID